MLSWQNKKRERETPESGCVGTCCTVHPCVIGAILQTFKRQNGGTRLWHRGPRGHGMDAQRSARTWYGKARTSSSNATATVIVMPPKPNPVQIDVGSNINGADVWRLFLWEEQSKATRNGIACKIRTSREEGKSMMAIIDLLHSSKVYRGLVRSICNMSTQASIMVPRQPLPAADEGESQLPGKTNIRYRMPLL